MSKRVSKLVACILNVVMIFNVFSPLLFIEKVSATTKPYTLNGVDSNNKIYLDLDGNNNKRISVNAGYRLSCDFEINNISLIQESENSCIIKATNYGYSETVLFIYDEDSNYYEETIKFDIAINDYLNKVLERVPSIVDVPNDYDFNQIFDFDLPDSFYYEVICKGNCDTTQRSFNIYVRDNNWNIYTYKTKDFDINVTGLNFNASINNLTIGDKQSIYLYNFKGDYSDLIWVSENPEIAKVNNRGEVTALAKGETIIYIYDKNTMDYITVLVTIYEKVGNISDKIDTLISFFENEIELNMGNLSWYPDGDIYTSYWYKTQVEELFYKKFNALLPGIYPISNINCTENICSIDFEFYTNGNNQYYSIPNFTVNKTGLYFTYYDEVILNTPFEIDVKSFLLEEDNITFEYDVDYFTNVGNEFIPIKTGTTKIKVISDSGYYHEFEFTINEDRDRITNLEAYLKSQYQVTLPYKKSNFNTILDLKILESFIATTLEQNYPIVAEIPYLKAKVTCLSNTNCTARFNIMATDDYFETNILGATSAKNINIQYDETNTVDFNVVKNAYNGIRKSYLFSLEETLDIEYACKGNTKDCLYEKMLDDSGINTLIETLDVRDTQARTSFTGGFNYELLANDTIYFDKLIYVDNIPVLQIASILKLNHVLSIPYSVIIKNETEKTNYIKDYINSYYGINNTSISLKGEDVYSINADGVLFDLLVLKKEIIKATQVEFKNNYYELNVGETLETANIYYPLDANYFDFTYEVVDESIASIDANGVITAYKKGYTVINIKNGSVSTRAIVCVGMTITELLNDVLKLVPISVEANYANIMHSDIYNAISNEIYNEIYKTNLPISVNVTEENNKYYVSLYVQKTYIYDQAERVYSNKQEISIVKKGISLSSTKYFLNINESKNINMSFTEGVANDLLFNISDDKIISFDKTTGVIKALKSGATSVYLYDKTNKYYNYFTVYVNIATAVNEAMDKVANETLEIDVKNIGINNSIEGAVSNKLYEYNIMNLSTSGSMFLECHEFTKTCDLRIDTMINNIEVPIMREISYKLVGIDLTEKEIDINIGEQYTPSYTVLETNEDVVLESLDEDICTISLNKVVGVSQGICYVKLTSESGYKNYLTAVVDRSGLNTYYSNLINNLDEELVLSIEQYDKEFAETTNDYMYFENYFVTINYNLRKLLGSSFENVYFDFNLNTLTDDNEMEIKWVPSYDFYEDNYYSHTTLNEVGRIFKLKFSQLDNSKMAEALEIQSKIKDVYELNLEQVIELKLRKDSFGNAYKYSDFINVLDGYSDYSLYYDIRMGGEDEYSSFNGGFYFLFYKDVLILSGETSFKVYLDITDLPIDTNEDIINAIKEKVSAIYKEKKEIIDNENTFLRVKSFSFFNLMAEEETTVNVEFAFDEVSLSTLYLIEIEDMKFAAKVLTKSASVSVIGISVNKSSIDLRVGDTATITATVAPTNATNKKLEWSSSNTNVVKVSSSGVITAVGAGSANIVVKTIEGGFSKTIAITVKLNALYGDVNNDGVINMADLIKLRKYLAGSEGLNTAQKTNADCNKDGNVNMADLIKLRKHLAGLEVIK